MTAFTHTKNCTSLSAGLMLLSNLFLAFGVLSAKMLSNTLALPLLIWLRFLIPGLLVWWVCLVTQTANFKLTHVRLHLLRAGFAVLCQYALFNYLRYGSVLDATLLYMTAPLFMPLIIRIIDHVRIKLYQKISLVIGFIGVIFILKPDTAFINGAALLGLSAGFFNACTQVTFHKLSHNTAIHHTSLVMFTFASMIALVPLLFFCHDLHSIDFGLSSINQHDFMLLLGLAFAAISNQAFKGRAYARVNKATSLAPFLYTVILFSGLLDWLFLNQVPDIWSCLGAVLIFSAGMMMLLVKSKHKFSPQEKYS